MQNGSVINIIMADDHEIFRDGFSALFRRSSEIKLLAEARNGQQLITLAGKLNPDVILTDIKMPGVDGIEATKVITARHPHIKIIALTMFDDDNLIIDMLEAGASGYLLKNAHKKEIIEAIRAVNRNEHYYCNQTTAKLAKLIAASRFNPRSTTGKDLFTGREKEIIIQICQGSMNKQISEKLFLSIRTIEGYRATIMEKMDVKNTAGIVVYAIRHGIFKP
jgi:DNA-binding NarL/FixJ family response regulator